MRDQDSVAVQSRFHEFTLDEAIAIAKRNDPGNKVPSVSRTLLAEINRLQSQQDGAQGGEATFLLDWKLDHIEIVDTGEGKAIAQAGGIPSEPLHKKVHHWRATVMTATDGAKPDSSALVAAIAPQATPAAVDDARHPAT